jgi:hypothetical protein
MEISKNFKEFIESGEPEPKLKESKKWIYVLSYDGPTKLEIVEFLLSKEITMTIESYTDSTIHFEWADSNYERWYEELSNKFKDMIFSINVVANDKEQSEHYFAYTSGKHIENNFKKDILDVAFAKIFDFK